MNYTCLIFISTLFILFRLVINTNDSLSEDEKSILDFLSQQMIALNESKCDLSIIEPDKVYQGFLTYVTSGNELTSAYYEKIIEILKIV